MGNKKMSTCSVVMSTYNGTSYIIQQLDSIRNQSILPDEVIIRDDNSSDNTVEVIREYINKYGLNWIFIFGEENKGYYRSFIDLAYMASSDVIFFCDQDDIWETNKIKICMDFFEKHADALAVSCNIRCVDKNNRPIRNHDYFNVKSTNLIELKDILYTSNILGCTLGFRSSLLQMISRAELKSTQGSHDTLISMLAAIKNGLYKIPYVGINYRIHGDNTSMKNDLSRETQIINTLNYYEDIVGAIVSEKSICNSLKVLKDVLNLQKCRLKFLKEKNIFAINRHLKKYCVYTGSIKKGIRLLCADIYYCYKK